MDSENGLVKASSIADLVIAISYFAIPIEIWLFQHFLAKPLPFKYVLVLSELFIASCGITHLIGMWFPWTTSGVGLLTTKWICAILDLVTVIVMVRIIPKLFSIPAKASLLEEELRFRVQHENELQQLNETLCKFRKITSEIRHTLNIQKICDTSTYQLSKNLSNVSGVAILFPESSQYVCQSEYINKREANSLYQIPDTGIKTHFWKTITVSMETELIKKLEKDTNLIKLKSEHFSQLIARQRGILYKKGLAKSFKLNDKRGIVLVFVDNIEWNATNQDLELFEDIVIQIQIALEQAYEIINEDIISKEIQIQTNEISYLNDQIYLFDWLNSIQKKLSTHLFLQFQLSNGDDETLIDKLIYLESQFNLYDFKFSTDSIIELKTLVQNSIQSFKTDKTIVNCHIDDSVPNVVKGEPNIVKIMINNILKNAVQYSNENSDILLIVDQNPQPPKEFATFLTSSSEAEMVSAAINPFSENLNSKKDKEKEIFFHIIDNGFGINQTQLNKICDLVRTLENVLNSADDLIPSVQFGLAITNILVKLMNGYLSICSSPQNGSVVTFSIKTEAIF